MQSSQNLWIRSQHINCNKPLSIVRSLQLTVTISIASYVELRQRVNHADITIVADSSDSGLRAHVGLKARYVLLKAVRWSSVLVCGD